MKICPKCQQTYADESLNFCLNDGSTLTQASAASGSAAEPIPETVMMSQPRPTNQQFNYQPSFQDSRNAPPQFPPQPQQHRGGSKSWIWAVGILGILALVCGGGLLGFFAWIANRDVTVANNGANRNLFTPTPSLNNFSKVDMSDWKTGTDEYAATQYADGVFTIRTLKDSVYYVIVAPKENKTQNKTTKLTVKNIEQKPVKYGYGLLVHSYTTPLIGDYGFLIDSDRKRYRVVQHSLKTEKELIKWTDSSAIKSGSEGNILEVRDNGNKMQFYVNGQYITTVDETITNSDGVAGIYSSDGIRVGFSNLEIEK